MKTNSYKADARLFMVAKKGIEKYTKQTLEAQDTAAALMILAAATRGDYSRGVEGGAGRRYEEERRKNRKVR